MLKVLSSAAYLTSHAHMMSMPNPTTEPWTATMTGKGALSGLVIAAWNFCINLCMVRDTRAPSGFVGKTRPRLGIDASLTA